MLSTIFNFAIYGGSSITLFLIFLLSKDWQKQAAKKILALVLLHFLGLFLLYSSLSNAAEQFLQWSGVAIFALFSAGPLLYFYVVATYENDFQFDRKFYKHFIPAFCVGLVISLQRVFFNPADIELSPNDPFVRFNFTLDLVIGLYGLASLWYYVFKSYRLILKYRVLIKEEYSSLVKNDLRWLSLWIKGLIILLTLDALAGVAAAQFPVVRQYLHLNVLVYMAFIWYVGYKGIFQPSVFLPQHLLNRLTPLGALEKEKLSRSAKVKNEDLTPTDLQQADRFIKSQTSQNEKTVTVLAERLEKVLREDQLFKKENLSLRELAKAINISDKQLSELLNGHLQTNFYEYINSYRVAAFKEMIQSGKAKDYTLLSLALGCGFSSKSSFNRIFKQQTGMTPSSFRKQYS